MKKIDLAREVSEATGLILDDANRVIDVVLLGIKEALINGDRVEIRGLGTFGVKLTKARIARNIKTGETIPVAPRRTPFFKPGKELKII